MCVLNIIAPKVCYEKLLIGCTEDFKRNLLIAINKNNKTRAEYFQYFYLYRISFPFFSSCFGFSVSFLSLFYFVYLLLVCFCILYCSFFISFSFLIISLAFLVILAQNLNSWFSLVSYKGLHCHQLEIAMSMHVYIAGYMH